MAVSLTVAGNAERASGEPDVRTGAPHHQPQLDGIRGLAILAVLCAHSVNVIGNVSLSKAGILIRSLLSPGGGGVDVFFALSGFLITGILLRSNGKPRYYSAFYARRVLRIFPIYYLFLVVSLLVCTQVPAIRDQVRGSEAHLPYTVGQKLSYFLYLQTIPVFWPTLAGGLTGLWGSFWSLAVEEQFYFVWPLTIRHIRSMTLYWFVFLLFWRVHSFGSGRLASRLTALGCCTSP